MGSSFAVFPVSQKNAAEKRAVFLRGGLYGQCAPIARPNRGRAAFLTDNRQSFPSPGRNPPDSEEILYCYARYTIFVDGEIAPQDGKMVTMVIGDLFALNNTIQENVKYSDYIKDKKIYGQKSVFIQPSEEKEYELTIVVPDKYNHLIYDYYEETDYGGQANYYDYNNGVFATVKFHDEESGANQTAYLNVFDEDGNLYFRKQLGIQTPCVCVSYDGSLIGTTISSESINDNNYDFENPSADIGKATIFDINGNKVFELDHGVFEMAISHDNRYVALDVTGENSIGIMDIQNKEILWKDYRGAQIRHLIFSEDDSILYMGSQECICAYDTKTGYDVTLMETNFRV